MIHLLHSINSFITSGGGEDESMFDIVMHHLTDHTITTGFIGKINEQYLSNKLFGIFDMRITRWVVMLWVAAVVCLIVFVPIARKIKNAKYGSSSKWVNLWEVLISFVHDEIVEPNFDHHYVKKAMPYFLRVFFCVLLLGRARSPRGSGVRNSAHVPDRNHRSFHQAVRSHRSSFREHDGGACRYYNLSLPCNDVPELLGRGGVRRRVPHDLSPGTPCGLYPGVYFRDALGDVYRFVNSRALTIAASLKWLLNFI